MGLRIIEREAQKRDEMRIQMLKEAAERFGAFKGNAALEQEFMEKMALIKNRMGTAAEASEAAARVEEDIRRENKRSMAMVGTLHPDLVLDLL